MGEIPTELGSLSNLSRLNLSSNQLIGPIPAELGSLSNLERLFLAGNQLSGPIPAELGNLSNLVELFLAGNQLTGCIPDGLRDVAYNDLSTLGLAYCGDSRIPGGGGDDYCRDGDVVQSGGRCDIYTTSFWFEVSDTQGCLRAGGISICAGNSITQRGSLNGVRVTLVAARNDDGSWTIDDVDPEPDD